MYKSVSPEPVTSSSNSESLHAETNTCDNLSGTCSSDSFSNWPPENCANLENTTGHPDQLEIPHDNPLFPKVVLKSPEERSKDRWTWKPHKPSHLFSYDFEKGLNIEGEDKEEENEEPSYFTRAITSMGDFFNITKSRFPNVNNGLKLLKRNWQDDASDCESPAYCQPSSSSPPSPQLESDGEHRSMTHHPPMDPPLIRHRQVRGMMEISPLPHTEEESPKTYRGKEEKDGNL